MFCSRCGSDTQNSNFCPVCGLAVYAGQQVPPPQGPPQNAYYTTNNYGPAPYGTFTPSDKNRWVAFVLCWFLGFLGVHRFYVGKIGTGVLYLLTAGLFGIGVLVDWIVILCGSFKDNYGRPLK